MNDVMQTVTLERGGNLTALPFDSMAFEQEWQVPKISDDRLQALMAHIKPVFFAGDGKLYFIEDVDPRNTAFTWDPKLTQEVDNSKFIELGHSFTFHNCGHYVFFKPSVAEVLAQVPEEYLEKVVAFSTELPEHRDDLSRVISKCGGMHRAVTTWYGLRPET